MVRCGPPNGRRDGTAPPGAPGDPSDPGDPGDPGGCWWIAPRDQDRQVLIVAIQVREDGGVHTPYRDALSCAVSATRRTKVSSPATCTGPVVTSVSTATRDNGPP